MMHHKIHNCDLGRPAGAAEQRHAAALSPSPLDGGDAQCRGDHGDGGAALRSDAQRLPLGGPDRCRGGLGRGRRQSRGLRAQRRSRGRRSLPRRRRDRRVLLGGRRAFHHHRQARVSRGAQGLALVDGNPLHRARVATGSSSRPSPSSSSSRHLDKFAPADARQIDRGRSTPAPATISRRRPSSPSASPSRRPADATTGAPTTA